MMTPTTDANETRKAGQPASDAVTFGEFDRYRVQSIHTRFDRVMWFVTDAERIGKDGKTVVVRQEFDFSAAIAGL